MSPARGVSPRAATGFRRALHSWYRRHHRPLPWRGTRDPYSVWVSEVLLQQTRVSTVLERYPAFLEAFPDIASLARAPESRVLAAWSGLGYYRRARMLHRAARLLRDQHAGRFPGEFEAIAALPGVGRSTAGAIYSIAFDRPAPILDGNVARVLQRLHAAPGGGAPAPARLWAMAEALLPARSGHVHSQAMMELGAMVCTPLAPRCGDCPVARWCGARAHGLQQRVPAPRPRAKGVAVDEHAAVAWRGSKLVLERRPQGGQLDGLVGLPLAGSRTALLGRLGRGARVSGELPMVRHSILNRRMRTFVWEAELPTGARLAPGLETFTPARIFEQPLDGTARKVLRARLEAERPRQ
ncbi:MAG: A/G-specific adenine glycosylase [Candidatus Eisenbacteria bacterium]|nr:A/G-specific adenine glycosylase [Candidatus Eisenbacteria bacterium]